MSSMSQERITDPWFQFRRMLSMFSSACGYFASRFDAFPDRLQHPELDPIMHQLGEVAGAGRARMDVAVGYREVLQQWLESGDRLILTTGHEAGAAARAIHAPARAEVDEVQAEASQAAMSRDRIAPVRVSTVGNEVAGLELGLELRQERVDRETGGNVEQDLPRAGQKIPEPGEAARGHEAGFDHLARRIAESKARDAPALLQGLQRQGGAHLSEADDAERPCSVIHVFHVVLQ
jgi:hypothetical protein